MTRPTCHSLPQGAFARVVRAWCAAKACEVAIKIISLDRVSTSLDDIRTEVRVMKICQHGNVLPLFCAFVPKHGAELWLVTPLMDKGTSSVAAFGLAVQGQGLFHAGYTGLVQAVVGRLATYGWPHVLDSWLYSSC